MKTRDGWFFSKWRLRTKLIVLNFVTSILASGLMVGMFSYNEYRTFYEDTEASLKSLSAIMAYNTAPTLGFWDMPGADQEATKGLSMLQTQPHILRATIFLPSGKAYAFYTRKGLSKVDFEAPKKVASSVEFLADEARVVWPIKTEDGKIVGSLLVQSDLTALQENLTTYGSMAAGVAVIALVISQILSTILSGFITRPLTTATEVMKEIAQGQGDLTVQVRIPSQDEVGRLVRYFNQVLENLHDLVVELKETAGRLMAAEENTLTGVIQSSDAMTAMETTMMELSLGAMTQADSARGAEEALNKAGNALVVLIDKAKSLANQNRETIQRVQEGRQGALRAMEGMEQIHGSMERTTDLVSLLLDRTRDIERVAAMMSSLSDQTNLLALNAAVEAARAGEHGLGFVVVSEQVRKLADASAGAAKVIQKLIKEIQADSHRAQTAIEEQEIDVDKGVGKVKEAMAAFEGIRHAVEETMKYLGAMETSTQTVEREHEQLAMATEQVRQQSLDTASQAKDADIQAKRVSAAVKDIHQSSEVLRDESGRLAALMIRFKTRY